MQESKPPDEVHYTTTKGPAPSPPIVVKIEVHTPTNQYEKGHFSLFPKKTDSKVEAIIIKSGNSRGIEIQTSPVDIRQVSFSDVKPKQEKKRRPKKKRILRSKSSKDSTNSRESKGSSGEEWSVSTISRESIRDAGSDDSKHSHSSHHKKKNSNDHHKSSDTHELDHHNNNIIDAKESEISHEIPHAEDHSDESKHKHHIFHHKNHPNEHHGHHKSSSTHDDNHDVSSIDSIEVYKKVIKHKHSDESIGSKGHSHTSEGSHEEEVNHHKTKKSHKHHKSSKHGDDNSIKSSDESAESSKSHSRKSKHSKHKTHSTKKAKKHEIVVDSNLPLQDSAHSIGSTHFKHTASSPINLSHEDLYYHEETPEIWSNCSCSSSEDTHSNLGESSSTQTEKKRLFKHSKRKKYTHTSHTELHGRKRSPSNSKCRGVFGNLFVKKECNDACLGKPNSFQQAQHQEYHGRKNKSVRLHRKSNSHENVGYCKPDCEGRKS